MFGEWTGVTMCSVQHHYLSSASSIERNYIIYIYIFGRSWCCCSIIKKPGKDNFERMEHLTQATSTLCQFNIDIAMGNYQRLDDLPAKEISRGQISIAVLDDQKVIHTNASAGKNRRRSSWFLMCSSGSCCQTRKSWSQGPLNHGECHYKEQVLSQQQLWKGDALFRQKNKNILTYFSMFTS